MVRFAILLFPLAAWAAHSTVTPEMQLRRSCSVCHGLDVVEAQHLSRDEWVIEFRKMEKMGARIQNRDALLDYLAKKHGDKSPR